MAEEVIEGSRIRLEILRGPALDRPPASAQEWDVAAGDCVYRKSGRDGERPSPLRYDQPDLRNTNFDLGIDD